MTEKQVSLEQWQGVQDEEGAGDRGALVNVSLLCT